MRWGWMRLGAALLVAGSAASAENLGTVRKLLRDNISIYDEKGTFIEKRPKWNIPREGAPIVEEAQGHLGILDASGNKVYLRSSEIETTGRPDFCIATDTSARGTARITASEGVGSGMSGTAARCVR